MKPNSAPGKRKRLKLAAAGVGLAVLLGYLAYQYWRPPSPEKVRDQTVQALQTGDAATLYSLADPTEVNKLHITPEAVQGILDQTLWHAGHPVFQHPLTRVRPQPVDMATWTYREDESSKKGPLIYIPVILDRDGRWYLNLSRLLEVSYLWRTGEPGNVDSMRDAYREAALKYGVAGVRGHAGGWVMFSPAGTPQDWSPKQANE